MTKVANRIITAAAAACVAIGAGVMAADNQPGGTTGNQPGNQGNQATGQEDHQRMRQEIQKADTPDKLFLLGTAMGNQMEIKWAQVAQQKSQNAQVKQVADAIVKDHQQLAQDLQKLIEQNGLTTPQHIPPLYDQAIQVLQAQSGDQFDQCFLSGVKAAHMASVSRFEDEAKIARDPAVKQFASQYLPTLQAHAQLVQQAAVAVGLPSGAEAIPAGSRIPANIGDRK
jgi:putative membrane protein